MMEITIHVPALEKLADALMAMAHPNASEPISSEEKTTKATNVSFVEVPTPNMQAAAPTPMQPEAPIPMDPAPVTVQQPIPMVPTTQTTYKMDDLSVAAIRLIESGKLSMGELQQIMAGFGVASLPELPEAQYGTFATILRQKGANI